MCSVLLSSRERIFGRSADAASQGSDTEWRRQDISNDKEVIIICSCGDEIDVSIEYTPKQIDNMSRDQLANVSEEECSLPLCFRQELDAILDKIKGVKSMTLTHVYFDSPGMQFSREYYLEKIKHALEESTKDGGDKCLVRYCLNYVPNLIPFVLDF